MTFRSIIVIIYLAIGLCPVTTADDNQKFCCLCNRCSAPLQERWNLFLNPRGLTCGKLDSIMFNPGNDSKAGNAVCKDLQYNHRKTCCDRSTPVKSVPQAPTPAPTYGKISYGTNNVCNLCLNGNKPSKPFTMITSNQIRGVQTCDSIYHLGQTGNIANALCYPLQLELKGPCGCSQPTPASPATSPTSPARTPATSPSPPVGTKNPPTRNHDQGAGATSKTDLKLGGKQGKGRGGTRARPL